MFKKLSLISLFTLLPASYYYAQTTVYGYLKDGDGKPVESATIDLKSSENDVTADKIGYFQFVDLMPGHYQVVITKPNFETKVMEFDVIEEKRKDLGTITLYSALTGADQGLAFIENTGDEENSSQTSTVGLLQSSQDIFNRIASFDLGAYWFRPRGIDGRAGETMMNGVSMVKSDNGNVDFSNWGGLNEITRYPEVASNHSPSEYAFGGVSSVFYKNTKASEYRKGFQFTQSLTNRNYRYRTSLRYTSGMNSKGWAFTVMGARRWAEEGIQEGTFYDAYGAYLGIEKKFNDKHTTTFNFIGAPYRRSTSSPNTQEVYDYMGVHYNSYWGWQDGEKRSERVRRGFQPLLQIQDFWKINKKSDLWTSLSYQFGKDYSSRFDWYNATNPSPTYYRKLPSYYINSIIYNSFNSGVDPASYTSLLDAYNTSDALWSSKDPKVTQIDWGKIYANNLNSIDGRSIIYLVDDVSDDKIWNASTHYTYNFNDKTKLILNASYQNYKSELYREVKDLLGGDYMLNQDPFRKNILPTDELSGLYNELDTEVRKTEGERVNYNYILSRQDLKVNPGLKFSSGNFDVFVSGLAGYTTSNREGLFKHYLFADSYGKSKNYDFWNFGLKGQVVYRLNGRNFLVYNGAVFSQAPFLEDLFINPRANAMVNPTIKNTVFDANDLSFIKNTPFVKMRLTAYIVNTSNETNVQRYFIEGVTAADGLTSSTFVSQVMSNVDKRNLGAELGLEVKVLPTLALQGVASYGQYTYQNNPDVKLVSDLFGDQVVDFGKSYIKNYRQGGTPQQGYSLGFRYNSPKYWWFGANWNYLDDNYLDPAPAVRTENFVQNVISVPYVGITEQDLRVLLAPTKLPSAHFLNANVGKSWLLGKYYVLISASVNNILDNTNYITGGFEQTRDSKAVDFALDFVSPKRSFGPRLWYNQGRSYFVNLQVRF